MKNTILQGEKDWKSNRNPTAREKDRVNEVNEKRQKTTDEYPYVIIIWHELQTCNSTCNFPDNLANKKRNHKIWKPNERDVKIYYTYNARVKKT